MFVKKANAVIYDFEKARQKIKENPDKYEVSELICLKCLNRAIHVYETDTLLKDLECTCGEVGFLIKTGQTIIER